MITLIAVLESWRVRYSLTDEQWLELAEQVSLTLDGCAHLYPPMPVDLADRIGVRTFAVAVRKVIEERLLGGLPGVEYPNAATTATDPPTECRIDVGRADLRKRRRTRCTYCGTEGHNTQTCPSRRFA